MITEFLKAFTFDTSSRQFRDKRSGRYVSRRDLTDRRQDYIDTETERNRALVDSLMSGEIDINGFVGTVKDNLKRNYFTQYMLGRGPNLSQRDYGILGAQLKKQYNFLKGFAQDIANGRYSDEQIGAILARLNLYTQSSGQAYERATAEAWGVELPDYPRSGNTPCLSNCTCSWVFDEDDTNIYATWELGATEQHCDECPDRARKWKRLKFRKGEQ